MNPLSIIKHNTFLRNKIMFLCCVLLNANLLAQNHTDLNKYDTINCSRLSLNKNGDTISTAFCAKYQLREYSFQSVYFENRPAFLMIYCHGVKGYKLVAEFMYDKWKKNKWIRNDYHAKSVPYRKQLLKKYLKTKDTIQYEHVQIK